MVQQIPVTKTVPHNNKTESTKTNYGMNLYKSTCGCKNQNQYWYRSRKITGCIKTASDRVCPENDCCQTIDIASDRIDSIMWEKVPSLNGKNITGPYINIDKDNDYYSNEFGFYLCRNDRKLWQVSSTSFIMNVYSLLF